MFAFVNLMKPSFNTLFPRLNSRRISYLLVCLLPTRFSIPVSLNLLSCIQRVFPISLVQFCFTHTKISNYSNRWYNSCLRMSTVQLTRILIINWSSGKGENYHRIHPHLLHCWARTKLGMIWTKPGREESNILQDGDDVAHPHPARLGGGATANSTF